MSSSVRFRDKAHEGLKEIKNTSLGYYNNRRTNQGTKCQGDDYAGLRGFSRTCEGKSAICYLT